MAWAVPSGLKRRDGVCRATDYGGDCEHDDLGAWQLDGPLGVCVGMCACCARCRFVSFSAKNKDCSWYASCDSFETSWAEPAGTSGAGYVTVQVVP